MALNFCLVKLTIYEDCDNLFWCYKICSIAFTDKQVVRQAISSGNFVFAAIFIEVHLNFLTVKSIQCS